MAKRFQLQLLSYYVVISIIGVVILLLHKVVFQIATPQPGEYFYSNLLRSNYTYSTGSLFFVLGIIAGYYLKKNPWLTGFAMIAAFPVVAMVEATVYKGSHNLIPFELAVHFLYALPAVLGAYLGRYFSGKRE
jgi:hypothetical protein